MNKNCSILTEKNRKIFEKMSVNELSELILNLKKEVKELENYNRFRMKFSDEKVEKKVIKQKKRIEANNGGELEKGNFFQAPQGEVTL